MIKRQSPDCAANRGRRSDAVPNSTTLRSHKTTLSNPPPYPPSQNPTPHSRPPPPRSHPIKPTRAGFQEVRGPACRLPRNPAQAQGRVQHLPLPPNLHPPHHLLLRVRPREAKVPRHKRRRPSRGHKMGRLKEVDQEGEEGGGEQVLDDGRRASVPGA